MLAALVTLSLLTGCGEPPVTLVGDLAETDARVGFAIDGELVVAYVCGGTQTMASHTRWFDDDLFGSEFEAESGGWTLTAQVDEAEVVGQLISPDEESWELTLTEEGALFESADSGCQDGAVLGPDGGELAVQGVWCDEIGSLAQVTPVVGLSLDLEVLPVQVETDSGLRSFDMTRVAP